MMRAVEVDGEQPECKAGANMKLEHDDVLPGVEQFVVLHCM